jgi:hypothetical protein
MKSFVDTFLVRDPAGKARANLWEVYGLYLEACAKANRPNALDIQRFIEVLKESGIPIRKKTDGENIQSLLLRSSNQQLRKKLNAIQSPKLPSYYIPGFTLTRENTLVIEHKQVEKAKEISSSFPFDLKKDPPDPNKEYTVEEVLQAGWLKENNKQGIYRRIRKGTLKAKLLGRKKIILGSEIIKTLEASPT